MLLAGNAGKPFVSIVRGNNANEMLAEGLKLIGGLNTIVRNNAKVLIKPNLCHLRRWETGATTDPILTKNLIYMLKDRTSDITIIESNHVSIDAELAFRKLGFQDVAVEAGVKLLNLSKGKMVEVTNSDGLFLKKFYVNEVLQNYDVLINLPVMKTSEVTLVSLSLKNMFGVLPERLKAKYHPVISSVIADINRHVKSSLCILDGRIGMEGNGPVYGEPVKMNTMIMGIDSVAVDSIGSRAMGFNPDSIVHIKLSEKLGVGSSVDIATVGDSLASVKRSFKTPHMPLRSKFGYFIQENRLLRPFTNVAAILKGELRKYS